MPAEDTEQPSFTDIDWEEQAVSTARLSRTAIVEIIAFTVLIGGFVYDYAFLNKSATITWPFVWDINSAEWMFLGTLLILVFHAVVPLYQNPRMTAYYWKEFKKNKAAVASLILLIVIFVIGIVGPIVLSPPEVQFTDRISPPVFNPLGSDGTWEHPFGTTDQGMDVAKLVIFGMRVSMEVGLTAMVMAVGIGSIVGTVAAYATSIERDWIDELLMRYVDIQSVFPVFLMLLIIIYLFSAQLWFIIALYGIFSWEGIARATRSEGLQRAEEEYVQAARAAGANTGSIVRRHMIPNVSNSIITLATLLIPGFILGEATLAFLGFSDPGVFSWGRTISLGRDNLTSAWWISTIPGIFLAFTALAFSFIGDAMRDALDPRQQADSNAKEGDR
ncbi:ABC transporter permease [Halocatena marina]|uniref:ABC transporter permease n=1 Tax=Halocatena marina TaxID=2934937 RepID=UPI00200D9A04|nr:ABC transporter permease [Halocatena marina]